MAMTAAGMWAKRKAAIAAVAPVQTSDPAAIAAYRDAIGIADCQAIIDEIHANAQVQVTGVQAGASNASGSVS